MRVAIVYFSREGSGRQKLENLAKAISRGLDKQALPGIQIRLIDGMSLSQEKLTPYDFLVFGAVATDILGKRLPSQFQEFLETAGMLVGKKTYAFVPRRFLGTERNLVTLMNLLESQGMVVRDFRDMSNEDEAQDFGMGLKLIK